MKKKKEEEKRCSGAVFSKFESQYRKLYCDTGLDRQGLGDGPGGAWSATTLPAAHARGLAGGECVTIQLLYHDRTEGLAGCGWVMIQSIVL